ncbi:MAG: DNA polymerase IV [Candidatus Pacebacteria bacterium]|nr:DNA polymerase IV [Candidatus Paceibacterota bacterium]
MKNRIIGHLDMDAFFASLEERATPSFRGKPIVVGSDPKEGKGRGVVSTANYKAREYDIHSAMPISRAWQLSEKAKSEGRERAIFVIPNFRLYVRSSNNVLNIIKKYSKLVEQASIDEFYFDLTPAKSYKKAEEIAKKIKEEIRKKEKVTCSIGIGPNKLIAKIAAGKNKPDGLLIVKPDKVNSFLGPLPIRELPGIGPKTAEVLHEQGVSVIRDLKKLKKADLRQMLHKAGEAIYEKARGIDDSLIVEEREVKSIGEQTTFEEDTLNPVYITEMLNELCESVFKKFTKSGFLKFKTISIVVRFSNFTTINSAKSFKDFLGKKDLKKFKLEALKLILPFFDKRKNPRLKLIRLIGIRIENFSD